MAEEFPRGQISTLILMCLSDSDMYGYEIINSVLSKTNGKVSIKQPSLYSSLKRMEEQSLISSYWRDSEIGGRRHYYHITDLGKKHLEKWQTSLSISITTEEEKNENIKVLHQENLFNLTSKIEDKSNELVIEPTTTPTFFQYDLFATSSSIVAASTESVTQPKHNQNIEQIEKPKTVNNMTEQPKTYTFEYVKKGNKSFSDTIKSKINFEDGKFSLYSTSSNLSSYEDFNNENYTSDKNLINENIQAQSQTNTINDFTNYDSEITKNDAGNLLINKINIDELEGYAGSKLKDNSKNFQPLQSETNENKDKIDDITQKKDDGVFITETIDIKDIPKMPRWEPTKLDIYISDNSISPKFLEKQNDSYENRIKALYEKSISNAENQELELIDSKLKFNSYVELQKYYSDQNIKFKPFQKSLYKSQKKFDMIKISKLNMLTSLLTFSFISIISLILGFILINNKDAYLNSPFTFVVLPILSLIYLAFSFIIYKKSPQKRIAFDINKFKLNETILILSIFIIPLILAINLFAGFNFSNFNKYVISIIYPSILSFIYLIYYISQRILIKLKILY